MVIVRKKSILAATVFGILMAPFLIQLAFTPPGYVATGFFSGGADYATFITKMKWGLEGHWTYENRFTSEPTEPVAIYRFYLFLGHLSGWTGLPLYWVFHLSRAFFGTAAIFYLWFFIKRHVPFYNPKIAMTLAVLASGGYLEATDCLLGTDFNKDNADFYLQSRVWLSLITYPHYCMELLGVLLFLDSYLSKRSWRALVGGGLISLAHPFLLGLFCPIVLISSLIRKDFKQAFISCALVSLTALPIIIPLYLALQKATWLEVWRSQTYIPTPPFVLFYVVGLGVVGIAGWYGYTVAIYQKNKEMILWLVWLSLAVLLSYLAPLPNKKEFSFFTSIPLGVLATPYVERIINWVKTGASSYLKSIICPGAVILLCIWQSLTLYTDCVLSSTKVHPEFCNYLSPEYQKTFEILTTSGENQVVLTSYWLGNLIPAHTKSKPFVGHLSETQNFKQKKRIADNFLKGDLTFHQMTDFIARNNISWIILDKATVKENKIIELFGEPFYKGKELLVWKTTF